MRRQPWASSTWLDIGTARFRTTGWTMTFRATFEGGWTSQERRTTVRNARYRQAASRPRGRAAASAPLVRSGHPAKLAPLSLLARDPVPRLQPRLTAHDQIGINIEKIAAYIDREAACSQWFRDTIDEISNIELQHQLSCNTGGSSCQCPPFPRGPKVPVLKEYNLRG